MRRRDFIAVFGRTAFIWPFAAHAQQGDRVRRVGVLVGLDKDDPETKARLAAFREGLQERGWGEGRNLQVDYRWAGPDAERIRSYAAELVGALPEVILRSLRQASPHCGRRPAPYQSFSRV